MKLHFLPFIAYKLTKNVFFAVFPCILGLILSFEVDFGNKRQGMYVVSMTVELSSFLFTI